MSRFDGKSVLVTGGASGIGRAAALAFAAEGGRVLVVDQNGEGAHATAEDIRAAGGHAEAMRADISDYGQCAAMVSRAMQAFGSLHVAFNNAGIPGSMTKAVHEYELHEWNQMLAVNLTGVFHCLKAEVPAMLASRGGAIVNTASVAGLVAAKHMASYISAKHGVVGLTRAAALDLIGQGIRGHARAGHGHPGDKSPYGGRPPDRPGGKRRRSGAGRFVSGLRRGQFCGRSCHASRRRADR